MVLACLVASDHIWQDYNNIQHEKLALVNEKKALESELEYHKYLSSKSLTRAMELEKQLHVATREQGMDNREFSLCAVFDSL